MILNKIVSDKLFFPYILSASNLGLSSLVPLLGFVLLKNVALCPLLAITAVILQNRYKTWNKLFFQATFYKAGLVLDILGDRLGNKASIRLGISFSLFKQPSENKNKQETVILGKFAHARINYSN